MGVLGDFRHAVTVLGSAFQEEEPEEPLDWAHKLFHRTAQDVVRTREISLALRHAGLDEEDVLPSLVEEGLRLQETEILEATDFVDAHGVVESFVHVSDQIDWTDEALQRGVAAGALGVCALVVVLVAVAPLLVVFVLTIVLGPVLYVVGVGRTREWQGFSAESRQRVHRLLTEQVRRTINETLSREGREEPFHVLSAPALSELPDRAHLVATPSVRRITRQTETMAYGSVGIAGPKGVGKSALLAGFCDQRFARPDSPELRVLISAPVKYDALEFLTHVFARLCEAIVASADPSPPRSRSAVALQVVGVLTLLGGVGWLGWEGSAVLSDEVRDMVLYVGLSSLGGLLGAVVWVTSLLFRRRPSSWAQKAEGRAVGGSLRRRVEVVLGLALVAVGAVGATFLWQDLPPRLPMVATLWTPYTAGLLLVATALVLFALGRRVAARAGRRPQTSAAIAEIARAHLRRLRYVQTLTTGVSAEFSPGTPMRLGRSRSRQWAEQQATLPQVIAQYREFATQAAQWWRDSNRGRGRIVVGIDEVDKIGEGETAQRFLNEVKTVFGTPHCLYLVTVSEDALTRFEQRPVAVRDTFDSAFDEIVRLERMGFGDIRDMPTRRVAGLTDPLVALCYVLSGGLPRDCLRVARSLVEIRRERGDEHPIDTAEFTRILVGREVAETKGAVLRRLSLDPAEGRLGKDQPSSEAVDRLLDPNWPALTPEGLGGVDGEPFTGADFAELRRRVMFLRAVLEVFSTRKARLVTLLRDSRIQAEQMLARLAAARITALGNLPTGPGFLHDVMPD